MNRMREEINRAALAPASVHADGGEQCYRFAESFLGFAGHFPGYPILPAILQTLLAQLVAEQVIGAPLQFSALQRAKFSRQLRPDEKIDVQVKCQEKDGQWYCAAELKVADEDAASFILVLSRGVAA